MGSAVAQLLTAAAQGNEEYTGVSARDTAAALEQLMIAVREVAASMDDKENKEASLPCLIISKTVCCLFLNLSIGHSDQEVNVNCTPGIGQPHANN